MPGEIWKSVVGYEGCYEVSSKGRVRSVERFLTRRNGVIYHAKSYILTQHVLPDTGYITVGLWDIGKSKTLKVHRLVAKAFLPNMSSIKLHVNHKDLDKENNHLENLEWVTKLENEHHALKHGRLDGTNNPNFRQKLNPEAVHAVKWLFYIGSRQRTIASIFGISQSMVSSTVNGKRWVDLVVRDG